jgi:hypothetical protein
VDLSTLNSPVDDPVIPVMISAEHATKIALPDLPQDTKTVTPKKTPKRRSTVLTTPTMFHFKIKEISSIKDDGESIIPKKKKDKGSDDE